MGEHLVIRGLPDSLARDGWWFLDDADASTPPPRSGGVLADWKTRRVHPTSVAVLVVLIVLADALIWDVDPGISVALFALALSASMIALKPGGVTRTQAALAMAFSLICNLPVIEQVQPLSLMFSALGLFALLVWLILGKGTKARQALLIFLQATFIGPLILPLDAAASARTIRTGYDMVTVARTIILPLSIGAVFLILFALANPILGRALDTITSIDALTPEHIKRAVFWVFAACLVWPYLNSQSLNWTTTAPSPKTRTPSALINEPSVRLSLILFNAMFSLQTISDLGVLTGGLTLPDGMTYAEYAHRGAYPLLVTALLSGAFAMLTQPMVKDTPALRILLFIWLGQTLFLVLTATLRLALHVQAYSLTHLRVAAFIWMSLIFLGLALIILQMLQNRPLSWLIKGNALALTATLYLCCFINFTHLITAYNMAHAAPEALDLAYLCGLGEQVIPAMMDYGQITDQTACGRGDIPRVQFDPIGHWQEWGFRRWRLQRHLETYHDR